MWRERGRGARDTGTADHRVRRPGYGELCRHLHRHLRRRMNDHEAYGVRRGVVTSIKLSKVGGRFIELWKRQHFPYLQVEETYLVRKDDEVFKEKHVSSLSWMTFLQESKQRRDNRDILADKIGGTLGKDR